MRISKFGSFVGIRKLKKILFEFGLAGFELCAKVHKGYPH